MRLDKLIAERYGLSRRAAQEAVRKGHVDVEGERCLNPGQDVAPPASVHLDPNRPRIGTHSRRLHVLFEDGDILIVNKPSGVLTQPTQARERDTLLERAGRYLSRKHGIARPYIGIVHRLDRDTTGAILLATSPHTLRPLQTMFRSHATERSYLAVVEGVFLTSSGRIDFPLVADRGDGRRGVSRRLSKGVPAVTHFQVLESFGQAASLLSCRLETGRTHQIRIHLAEVGHPVVGDSVYGSRTGSNFPVRHARQALHAQSIGLVHPFTGQAIYVEAPMADDLAELLSSLRDGFGHSSS
jgi:23S rRNA pseudouridine1911/1915/1917 synthase